MAWLLAGASGGMQVGAVGVVEVDRCVCEPVMRVVDVD